MTSPDICCETDMELPVCVWQSRILFHLLTSSRVLRVAYADHDVVCNGFESAKSKRSAVQ